jgi:hypothetical protein
VKLSRKKSDNNTESYSTTGVPKMFPTMKTSGYVHGCTRR